MRTWTLRVGDYTKPPLSLNDRMHWRKKAGITRTIRAGVADDAGRTVPACSAATVELHYVPRDKRRRDPDNLVVPLFKALCDGIVDAGIVPDDTPAYMVRSMPVIAAPDGDPRLLLTIREIL